jgi:hypothetical protein
MKKRARSTLEINNVINCVAELTAVRRNQVLIERELVDPAWPPRVKEEFAGILYDYVTAEADILEFWGLPFFGQRFHTTPENHS